MNAVDTPRGPREALHGSAAIEEGTVSLRQLAQLSDVGLSDLLELIDYGVLVPAPSGPGAELFAVRYIPVLQQAQRLRSDLALDAHAFALAVMLCGRIVDVETELRRAKSDLRHCRAESTASA